MTPLSIIGRGSATPNTKPIPTFDAAAVAAATKVLNSTSINKTSKLTPFSVEEETAKAPALDTSSRMTAAEMLRADVEAGLISEEDYDQQLAEAMQFLREQQLMLATMFVHGGGTSSMPLFGEGGSVDDLLNEDDETEVENALTQLLAIKADSTEKDKERKV